MSLDGWDDIDDSLHSRLPQNLYRRHISPSSIEEVQHANWKQEWAERAPPPHLARGAPPKVPPKDMPKDTPKGKDKGKGKGKGKPDPQPQPAPTPVYERRSMDSSFGEALPPIQEEEAEDERDEGGFESFSGTGTATVIVAQDAEPDPWDMDIDVDDSALVDPNDSVLKSAQALADVLDDALHIDVGAESNTPDGASLRLADPALQPPPTSASVESLRGVLAAHGQKRQEKAAAPPADSSQQPQEQSQQSQQSQLPRAMRMGIEVFQEAILRHLWGKAGKGGVQASRWAVPERQADAKGNKKSRGRGRGRTDQSKTQHAGVDAISLDYGAPDSGGNEQDPPTKPVDESQGGSSTSTNTEQAKQETVVKRPLGRRGGIQASKWAVVEDEVVDVATQGRSKRGIEASKWAVVEDEVAGTTPQDEVRPRGEEKHEEDRTVKNLGDQDGDNDPLGIHCEPTPLVLVDDAMLSLSASRQSLSLPSFDLSSPGKARSGAAPPSPEIAPLFPDTSSSYEGFDLAREWPSPTGEPLSIGDLSGLLATATPQTPTTPNLLGELRLEIADTSSLIVNMSHSPARSSEDVTQASGVSASEGRDSPQDAAPAPRNIGTIGDHLSSPRMSLPVHLSSPRPAATPPTSPVLSTRTPQHIKLFSPIRQPRPPPMRTGSEASLAEAVTWRASGRKTEIMPPAASGLGPASSPSPAPAPAPAPAVEVEPPASPSPAPAAAAGMLAWSSISSSRRRAESQLRSASPGVGTGTPTSMDLTTLASAAWLRVGGRTPPASSSGSASSDGTITPRPSPAVSPTPTLRPSPAATPVAQEGVGLGVPVPGLPADVTPREGDGQREGQPQPQREKAQGGRCSSSFEAILAEIRKNRETLDAMMKRSAANRRGRAEAEAEA